MFLQPITSLAPIAPLKANAVQSAGADNQIPFKSLFNDAVADMKNADLELQGEIQKVVTGQSDDLHNVNIASTKAALALEVVVQLRNKALDSYNEIMRMGV